MASTIITTNEPLSFLLNARQFLECSNLAFQSHQQNEYNINIKTDWLNSLCTVYCNLDADAVTKTANLDSVTQFNLTNPEHVDEIKQYAFQLGHDSKYWVGQGSFTFSTLEEVSVSKQIQSSLNLFLLQIFLRNHRFKVLKSTIDAQLNTVQSQEEICFNDERILSQLGEFINVQNTQDVLHQLISMGIFDKKVNTDFIYNGDQLTFPIHLKIKNDIANTENIKYVLNLNLIQHCPVERSFRVWLHSIWDQTEQLNSQIDNLKCLFNCKSVQYSSELDDLNSQIYDLQQQLNSKNITIQNLEAQLQNDINSLTTNISSMTTEIQSLEAKKADLNKQIVNPTSYPLSKHQLMARKQLMHDIQNRLFSNSNEHINGEYVTHVDKMLSEWKEKKARAMAEKSRIEVELKSIQVQLQCTVVSVKELKETIERLSKKSSIIKHQQETMQLHKKSIEMVWSHQNSALIQMCREIDECTKSLNSFHSMRDSTSEQLSSLQTMIATNHKKLKAYKQQHEETNKEQLNLLSQIEIITNDSQNLQNEYQKYETEIQKSIKEIKKKKQTQQILKQKETSITQNLHEHNEGVHLINQNIAHFEKQEQKLNFSRVMMEISVRSKLKSYVDASIELTDELHSMEEYNKLLYDIINRLVQVIEKNNHTRTEKKQYLMSLEKKISSMQTTIITLKEKVNELKDTKSELLKKIEVLQLHLEEKTVDHFEHNKQTTFLQQQIDLLQLYNAQLVKQQKLYIDHIYDLENSVTNVQLHHVKPISSDTDSLQERIKYLNHLEKLTSILHMCKANYGVYRNLFDVYKLTEVLKMCKKLIEIKLRIDKINRTKHFGIEDGSVTVMNATIDFTKFLIASTPADIAYSNIRKYLQRFVDKWRLKQYKKDGINRFPRPTDSELMKFQFKMTIYRIQKERRLKREESKKQ